MEQPALYAVVITGFAASFASFAAVLRAGMALGVAYGVWGATSVALTAAMSAALFAEPLTAVLLVGIVLIVGGVLVVEIGSQRGARRAEDWTPRLALKGMHRDAVGLLGRRDREGGSRDAVAARSHLRQQAVVRRRGRGYLTAFSLLGLAVNAGSALGVAYGVWTAAGVALTAVLSRVLFGEVLNRTMAVGIGLIIVGVLLVEVTWAPARCSDTRVGLLHE